MSPCISRSVVIIKIHSVAGRQVNTSNVKKSVFVHKDGEKREYSESTKTKFAQYVDEEKISILKIDLIGSKDLKQTAEDLELIPSKTSTKKSDVALRNELKTLAEYMMHEQKRGQGVCHQYVQVSFTT